MKTMSSFAVTAAALLFGAVAANTFAANRSFLTGEPIFPLEHWHSHGSCIVEAPKLGGCLLVSATP